MSLTAESELSIRKFFNKEYYIDNTRIARNMHLTLYHSRRPMLSLTEYSKQVNYSIDTLDTRFMVMAPGGENPRPNISASKNKVGIRIKRSCEFRSIIDKYREAIIKHEDQKALGARKKSVIGKQN